VKAWNTTTSTYQVSSDTRFLYDGFNLIAEFNGLASNAVVRTYVWGTDLSGSLQGAGGIGGLLAVNTASATYFPTFDGNGNVTGLVNAADGSLAAEFEFDPFGNVIKAVGAAANAQPFGFSTKYTDTETGLVYYGPNRYYNPIPGRFINRDPIEENGGLNLYGFVDNDPINYFDTDGLRKDSSRGSYWREWKKNNPNRDKNGDSQRKKTLNRGCVGITCLNLGTPGMPDTSNCYRMRAQAEARQAEMKKNCECSGTSPNKTPSEPRIYSIHLWNDTGKDGKNPDVTFDSAGKADMWNWDYDPQPSPDDRWVNFDYGWLNNSGTIQHANHLHDPWGKYGSMKVYESTEAEWQRSYKDFNTEVWCTACNKDRF
jgi:RHS repeat-associated protein